jgi:hypothetical protein
MAAFVALLKAASWPGTLQFLPTVFDFLEHKKSGATEVAAGRIEPSVHLRGHNALDVQFAQANCWREAPPSRYFSSLALNRL